MNSSSPDNLEKPTPKDPSSDLWNQLQKQETTAKKPVFIMLTLGLVIAIGVLIAGLVIVLQ
jgi:hypothetical protein